MDAWIFISSGVVIAACVGFMIVGAAYKWDLTSPGYGRWMRIVGAVALVALSLVVVGDRIEDLRVAAAALLVGGSLAAAYVWAHRRLSDRLAAGSGPSAEK